MRLLWWQKKVETESVPEVKARGPRHPRLVFEVEDGHINVTADWPELASDEQAISVARDLARMTYYLCDGQLLALVQQAIAVTGQLKDQVKLSQNVLNALNQIYLSQAATAPGPAVPPQRSGPVIAADEVFSRG